MKQIWNITQDFTMAIKVKSNKKQRWRIPRGLGAHSILDSVKLVTCLNSRPPHCPDAGKTALENGRSAFFISFSIFFSLPENLGYFQVLTRHRGPQAFWQQEPVLWKIFPQTKGVQAIGRGCIYRWSFAGLPASHLLLYCPVPGIGDPWLRLWSEYNR